MNHIIGQEKLLSIVNSFTLDTLPKTLLFIGEVGCGKKLITSYIANKFKLNFKIIEESVDSDQLIEYSQNPLPTMYLIDLAKFTEKQQNQFLKFIEEPAKNVYISLIAESEIGVLPTVLNRCIKYYFEPYTPEQLQQIGFETYSLDSIYYKICNTPGKMIGESEASVQAAFNLCNTLVHSIQNASWANTLKIATKINFKEDYDKINFNLFLDTLNYVAFNVYLNENIPLAFIIYEKVNAAKQSLIDKNIVKENFMFNFLTNLWKETR